MFINRNEELQILQNWYDSKDSVLAILYGKRRVGKTELIKQFIKDKQGVYYLCDKKNLNDQAVALAKLIAEQTGNRLFELVEDWYSLAKTLKEEMKERFILAIDEFPYLAEVDKSASSVFQKMWDEYLKDSNIFLILSGSSISMMEAETLAYKAPLYGRRTGQILLKPMNFTDAHKFYPNLSEKDFMEFFAVLGGMPAYLKKFDEIKSILENIEEQVLRKDSYLHNEIEFVLREEFRTPTNYMAILQAMSGGARRFSEIASKTGLTATQLSPYLSTLEKLQFVEREIPITEAKPLKSKKGLYRVSDNFFAFWFTYVLPFRSDIEIGKYDRVQAELEKHFKLFVSQAYVDLARQKVQNDARFPSTVGRWWTRHEEIDIVALDEKENRIVFGEAKWSDNPVGVDLYYSLKKKTEQVEWKQGKRKEEFVFFSKSGYTKEMEELAREKGNIYLLG